MNIENYTTLSYQERTCKDINEIVAPLFNSFPINFFSHLRDFCDGHFTSLMTNVDLSQYYINKKYPICISSGKGIKFDTGFYVMDHAHEMGYCQRKKEIRELFNLEHLVCIVDKLQNYDDVYFFATTPENSRMINQLINNIDVVKHFILYFKDKSLKIIEKAPKFHCSPELFLKDQYGNISSNGISENYSQIKSEYHKNMPIRKIELTLNNKSIKITRREYDCLKYLAMGFSYKEIGKFLELSPRTVETYINTVKCKLNVDAKQNLIILLKEFFLLGL